MKLLSLGKGTQEAFIPSSPVFLDSARIGDEPTNGQVRIAHILNRQEFYEEFSKKDLRKVSRNAKIAQHKPAPRREPTSVKKQARQAQRQAPIQALEAQDTRLASIAVERRYPLAGLPVVGKLLSKYVSHLAIVSTGEQMRARAQHTRRAQIGAVGAVVLLYTGGQVIGGLFGGDSPNPNTPNTVTPGATHGPTTTKKPTVQLHGLGEIQPFVAPTDTAPIDTVASYAFLPLEQPTPDEV